MTLFNQLQSVCILLLMLLGVYHAKKHRQTLHIKTMCTAIIWDVLLVLQIEFGRSAIATAVKVQSNHPLLTIHILLALASLFFYGIMVWSGRQYLQAPSAKAKQGHRRLGLITLTLRALTLGTSLWYTFILKPQLG